MDVRCSCAVAGATTVEFPPRFLEGRLVVLALLHENWPQRKAIAAGGRLTVAFP